MMNWDEEMYWDLWSAPTISRTSSSQRYRQRGLAVIQSICDHVSNAGGSSARVPSSSPSFDSIVISFLKLSRVIKIHTPLLKQPHKGHFKYSALYNHPGPNKIMGLDIQHLNPKKSRVRVELTADLMGCPRI